MLPEFQAGCPMKLPRLPDAVAGPRVPSEELFLTFLTTINSRTSARENDRFF